MKTTMTITKPNPKGVAGAVYYFIIEFNKSDFPLVLDEIERTKTAEDVVDSKVWTVK